MAANIVYIFNAGSRKTFEMQKQLSQSINSKYEVGKDSINIAAISNNNRASLPSLVFNLREHLNNQAANSAIRNIQYVRNRNELASALQLARDKVFGKLASDRKYQPNSIVLFYDGEDGVMSSEKQQQDIKRIVDELYNQGINIVPIGIGGQTPEVQSAIVKLSGDPGVLVKDVDGLDQNTMDGIATKLLIGTFFVRLEHSSSL